MNRHTHFLDRRHFLALSIGLAATAGCRRQVDVDESVGSQRTDVPLRLLLVGSQEDGEAIRRAWESIAELPLEVKVIAINRGNPAEMASKIVDAALDTDLLLYPLAAVAELDARDVITPLSEEEYERIEAETGQLYAALRSGAARYSAKFVGLPQGAPQPALVSNSRLPDTAADPTSSEEATSANYLSWQQYDQWVREQWQSSAAEPVAPGWAAAMYLWRAATNTRWLFDRETFRPLITDDHYVQTLQQMVDANAAYQLDSAKSLQSLEQRTPGKIWQAVQAGQLRGGIGIPGGTADDQGNPISLRPLPQTSELPKVLFDPFSPLLSLSANCRQSAAAKRFMQWISGGEGSEAVRRQVSGMTPLRPQIGGGTMEAETALERGDSAGSSTLADGAYQRLLTETLSTPLTLPTLQIRRGFDYYAALDQSILSAIERKASPKQALQQAASQWQSITQEIGAEKQLRWWRRAQGMRG